MTLRLDPRYPLVWRTPDSLQLGVDNPPLVLESVTPGHERMLAGLAVGLTPEGLALLGRQSGLSSTQVEEFRRVIQPVLYARQAPRSARVVVAGAGPTADRIAWRLAEAGAQAKQTGARPEAAAEASQQKCAADIAVVVGHYVLDPAFRSLWLRRDLPHLPIVYGDTAAVIGPMIEPGHSPCLYCLELSRRDADPAWPVLATQLLGRASTAETPFFASEVATLATRMILGRAAGTASTTAVSVTLDAETGQRKASGSAHRHPGCACTAVPEVSGPARQESGTAHLRPSAAPTSPPTTAGDVPVPA